MSRIFRVLSARARSERGFTMVMAVMVLLASAIITYAAMDAVAQDAGGVRNSLDQNRSLDAADAGLAAFRQQLSANPQYWSLCPTVTSATVPASTDAGSTESYSYHVLPATTAPSNDNRCDTANPTGTVIEGNNIASGSFRVEISGTSGKATRSIVAQFRPPSFLNYVYYTDYEMLDPLINSSGCNSWLTSNYSVANPPYYWTAISGGIAGPTRIANCGDIQFVTNDVINGPLHSNDYLDICGSPVFGRSGESPPDAIETPGTYSDSGCANAATYNTASGAPNTNAGSLTRPSTAAALQTVADGNNASLTNGCSATAGCVFTGPTWITLNGSTVTVQNAAYNSGTATTLTAGYPHNGVIYVQNGSGTCSPYSNTSPDYPTSGDPCGDATVSETTGSNYTASLTIASANDVIVASSLTTAMDSNHEPANNDFLGLIANDFVRIAHPCGSGGNTTSGGYSSLTSPYVDAAILAVNHSFIVDNFGCGASLGTLHIDGALAQAFRGAVGTGGGQGGVSSGYLKDYEYDGALLSESPPYFLAPTSSTWLLVREAECDTTC